MSLPELVLELRRKGGQSGGIGSVNHGHTAMDHTPVCEDMNTFD